MDRLFSPWVKNPDLSAFQILAPSFDKGVFPWDGVISCLQMPLIMAPHKLVLGGHQIGETALFGWASSCQFPFPPTTFSVLSMPLFSFQFGGMEGKPGWGRGGGRRGGTGVKMGIGLHQTNTMEPPFLLEIKSRSCGARTKICITLYGKLGILFFSPPPHFPRRSLLHLPIIH